MTVLYPPACIEHERKLLVWLFREWRPFDAEQHGLAVLRGEMPVCVKPGRAYLGVSFREWPLNSVVLFYQAVAQPRVITKPPLRHALPFYERMLGTRPSREQLLAASKLVCQREEDVEIGLGIGQGERPHDSPR
jgi:hypothetical protein